MKKLLEVTQKKVSLEELMQLYHIQSYMSLYEKVKYLVEAGKLTPIKNSGLNGKHPALYKRYRIIEEVKDTRLYEEELRYQMSTQMDVSYYMKHLDQYKEDREQVLLLNRYLKSRDTKVEKVSVNERSFEVWGREKFLKQEGGMTILKRLGLSLEDLNVYETVIPVAYYSHHKKVPQNVLIVENMDTFYSIRQHLMNENTQITGIEIGTVVYGAGKQIVKGFESFLDLGESYLKHPRNVFLYFGDLDYEGIQIYESLKERAKANCSMKLAINLYKSMISKSEQMQMSLPKMKEQQIKCDITQFCENFQLEDRKRIQYILESGKYIPQEILNTKDF